MYLEFVLKNWEAFGPDEHIGASDPCKLNVFNLQNNPVISFHSAHLTEIINKIKGTEGGRGFFEKKHRMLVEDLRT